jgi:hypothetical protein
MSKKEKQELGIGDNIIDRYTKKDDKGNPINYNMAAAILELDSRCYIQAQKIEKLEEAIGFFANWYENNVEKKIVLPGDDSFNSIKSKIQL